MKIEGFGMNVSASIKSANLKIHALNWVVSSLFLFVMAIFGWAVVAPLALAESIPFLAAVFGYMLSGAALYGVTLLSMWLAALLERTGCGLGALLLLGIFPFSVKAIEALKVGFLFTFSIHWIWLVLFGIAYVGIIRYVMLRYTEITLSVGFTRPPGYEEETGGEAES